MLDPLGAVLGRYVVLICDCILRLFRGCSGFKEGIGQTPLGAILERYVVLTGASVVMGAVGGGGRLFDKALVG